MKHSKPKNISLFLMVASMVLLAAFQAFWLRKEYNEQKSILQKETDILFRNTIQVLEDSMLQNKVVIPMKMYANRKSLKSYLTTVPKNTKPAYRKQITYSTGKPIVLPDTPIFATAAKKNIVRFEGSETFTFREMARYMQVSKIDTPLISSDNHFFEVLRKTKPDHIQSVKTNIVGNMNITTLTVSDTSPQGKKEIFIVRSHPPPDTLKQLFGKVARVVMFHHNKRDSIRSPLTDKSDKFNISVTINETEEKSNKNSRRQRKSNDNQLIINISVKDSIKIKDIHRVYNKQIQQAKINLPFQAIRRQITKALKNDDSKILITTAVTSTMPIGSTYAAIFPNYQGYLFKKIIPQGLFAFFLLAITGLAFGVIYRNLQQQRRLTELKNDFISNVTHELKTPIATVSVAIEALQNFGVAQNPKLTEEYLEISKNELNRLTLLVDKVLKMTTFEQQGLNLNLESVNVSDLVQQVLGSLKLQFEKYRAEVSFNVIGQGFVISADKIHLTNVIYNLLDNALKYSENKPDINIELQGNDSEIKLSISDKGIGIPIEYQDKIFEKFFRVPTGNMHNVKGYGLGLNYVASVIKQHNGEIEVQSELKKGSMFTLTLQKA